MACCKWCYYVLALVTPTQVVAVALHAVVSCDKIVHRLQEELFPAPMFYAWLAIVSQLLSKRHCVEAWQFRPGLDYRLATSEEKEAWLDVVLGLTPEVWHEGQEESSRRGGHTSRWRQGAMAHQLELLGAPGLCQIPVRAKG
jgi:hypothetical protein